MEKKKNGLHGIISAILVFAAVIASSIFVFSFLQYYFGMWGLAATELGILLITIVGALIVKVKPSEMFPTKKVTAGQVFGVIVMWLATMILMVIVNMALFFFFPEATSINREMNDFFNTWPVVPMLFVVTIMPAVCEEALHRGFILSGFRRRIRSKWALCIIMGIIFGIFHLDFYRFLGTGLLGVVMTYILLETDNFFLNMLFHFFNNFIIEVMTLSFAGSSSVSQASDMLSKDTIPFLFAVYCIFGCICPLIFLGGSMLLKGRAKLRAEGKFRLGVSIIFAVFCSLVLLITGVVILGYIMSQGGEVLL